MVTGPGHALLCVARGACVLGLILGAAPQGDGAVRATIDAATRAAAAHLQQCSKQALDLTNDKAADNKIRAVHMHRHKRAFQGYETDVGSVFVCRGAADVVDSVAAALRAITLLPDIRQASLSPGSVSAPAAGAPKASSLPTVKATAVRVLRRALQRVDGVIPDMLRQSGQKSLDSLQETAEADGRLALFMLIKCKNSLTEAVREVGQAVHPGQPQEVSEVMDFLQGVLELVLASVAGLVAAVKGAVLGAPRAAAMSLLRAFSSWRLGVQLPQRWRFGDCMPQLEAQQTWQPMLPCSSECMSACGFG